MQDSEQITDPEAGALYKELLALRRYGVRRGLEKLSTPTLDAVARSLSSDPNQPRVDQIMAALPIAAQHMGELYESAVANIMDFGSTEKRFLKQRRQVVARQLVISEKYLAEHHEKWMLKRLADHLVRLARQQRATSSEGSATSLDDKADTPSDTTPLPSSQRPVAPANIVLERTDGQVDGGATNVTSGPIVDELRRACYHGVEKVVERQTIPLLISLAETAVTNTSTTLQKVEELFVWAIYEVEKVRLRQEGLVELFELGTLRDLSHELRRSRARPHLSYENDTKRKPYRPGEEEARIFEALGPLLASLALQAGVTA